MKQAIAEAEKCKPIHDRIPMVGAVIAVDGVVIGRGYRGTGARGDDDHAEKRALASIADRSRLNEATVFTTLEPCTPEVRSVPLDCCTALISQARVKKVCIGILDPNQGVRGKGLWELQDRKIEVELFPHDLAEKVRVLNDKFVRMQQTLGMRITNLQSGQEVDTTRTNGELWVEGKCLNRPGDDVFAFTNIGGAYWPQPHRVEMITDKKWRIKVHVGTDGRLTIYILKANELGTVLVNYYRKCCNAQLERVKMLRGKLKLDGQNEEEFLSGALPSAYQGIEMGSLPKGLELQDKVDIILQKTRFNSLEDIVAVVPDALVPALGRKWEPAALAEANSLLARSAMGATVEFEVAVGRAEPTPRGGYAKTPRLNATLPDNPRLNTKDWLWFYFTDADEETTARFERLKVGDRVVLRGKIGRADIRLEGNELRLNVDVHAARFSP